MRGERGADDEDQAETNALQSREHVVPDRHVELTAGRRCPAAVVFDGLIGLTGNATPAAEAGFDPPIECRSCDAWNEPQAPFRIHGDTCYVGTAGRASILVDTGDGLLLFDGALPQSAPLQRLSGAPLVTHEAARLAVLEGRLQSDDPQYEPGAPSGRFPPVTKVVTVADGRSCQSATRRYARSIRLAIHRAA